MIPLVLVAIGLLAVAVGWWLMRGLGPGARVGRILAATKVVEMGVATGLASSGERRYVGVGGRVDAEDPWEDENGRPLVLRRSVLERRDGGRWIPLQEERRVVPFELSGALERIGVDGAALDEGLVVVTRESRGTAAEVPDRVPPGTPPATPIRYRVQLLSAVDHALVLGVPTMGADGPVMTAGLGRPLILTTLEPSEAMRLLASGRRRTALAIGLLLAAGLGLVGVGVAAVLVDALL
ncbi:MAG TPA: hypothetical protein VFY23_03190 [Candidatus Limnocylindrales bacterium]|nr:hypothetical protein [Candidatus Limnocylindrales bacterium]